jgi:DNA-binding Lrp family transcriptional regulator
MSLKKSESGKTLASSAAPESAEPHLGTLDRFDIAILQALQADARLSNAELAARIGLSAAPTWRRVKWLEEQGYITGYRAELDRRKIGLGVLAFVRLDAERNNSESTRALEDAIRARPEVVACHYIAWRWKCCSSCPTSRTFTPAFRSARSRPVRPCRWLTWPTSHRCGADGRTHPGCYPRALREQTQQPD